MSTIPVSDFSRFRTPYSERFPVRFSPSGPVITQQHHKDDCDINVIMRRYQQSGVLPDSFNPISTLYEDVSGADFQAAMELVANASSMFNELPSQVRDRFQNDPSRFLDFCSDERNRPEMASMGLLSADAMSRLAQMPPPVQSAPTGSNVPSQASSSSGAASASSA